MYTNVWYVAAQADQLTDEPVHVTMLGADFVLFRDADGAAQCISNVCPHRGASLADGVLYRDGTIACPFHGWRFNGAGRCTLIPSRRDHEVDVVAPGARIDAYATVERYGLVWVCLGDDPDAASPIFDMPEWGNDDFRFTFNEEIWEADYHTAKFSNLDYVHLPVVHGILFSGNPNPIQAPEHRITATEHGLQSVMRVNPRPSEGVWSTLRDPETKIESILRFFVPGFTLRGQVEIGGIGSGMFNIFYEFSTPIDEYRTMMRTYFLRNYKMEPEFDVEHTRRNLQNVHQDKRQAEAQRPRGAATGPNPAGMYTHDEDGIVLTYWGLMENMRDKGWQIDRERLAEYERRPYVRIVPSPLRQRHPDGWPRPAMPRIAPGEATEARVADLGYVDVDRIEPTRLIDYGESEPVRPRDSLSSATLEWESAARARLDQAPEFVRPIIVENAEKAARENGTNFVTIALLDELRANQAGEVREPPA